MLFQWSSSYAKNSGNAITAVFAIVFVVFTAQFTCYSRNMLRRVASTFEFWFVMGQMTVVSVGWALGDAKEKEWSTLCVRVVLLTVQGLCLFGIDASFFSRHVKAFVMLIMAILWFAWFVLVQYIDREGFDESLSIFGMKSIGIRATISSSTFTIFVFNLKYAFVSVVRKSDVIMLQFNPRMIPNPVEFVHLDHPSPEDVELLQPTNYRFS